MSKQWTVVNTVICLTFVSEHGQVVEYCEHSNGNVIWLTTWSNCWNAGNRVTGMSFGSEHGQVTDCCEHCNRCVICLRTWSSNGLL